MSFFEAVSKTEVMSSTHIQTYTRSLPSRAPSSPSKRFNSAASGFPAVSETPHTHAHEKKKNALPFGGLYVMQKSDDSVRGHRLDIHTTTAFAASR
jgi:hypothetical protein